MLAVSLDRFRSVVDAWGHEVGDSILREAVMRLKPLLGPGAELARTADDEFAVTLESEANPRALKLIAQRIVAELSEPFDVEGSMAPLSASVGIAAFPVNADDGAPLFRAASLALGRARADGSQMLRFFDTEMEAQLKRRTALERDLRLALQRDEFVVFYQPQMNLKTGEVCG